MTKPKNQTKTSSKASTKLETKTQIRNGAARADKLLRGIDNQIVRLETTTRKEVDTLKEQAKEVRGLLTGLSNAALTASSPASPPVKAVKSAPASKPAPTSKPGPAKKPQVSKPQKAQSKSAIKSNKTASKSPTKTVANPESHPEADPNRPPLKDVLRSLIRKNGSLTAPDLYKAATQAYGYWSRQSLYNVLKDTTAFKKVGDKFEEVGGEYTSDDEAEKFVESVKNNQATALVS